MVGDRLKDELALHIERDHMVRSFEDQLPHGAAGRAHSLRHGLHARKRHGVVVARVCQQNGKPDLWR